MADVIIHHREQGLSLRLPYVIQIDGHPVCVMQSQHVHLRMPEGRHTLTVSCWLYLRLLKRKIGGSVEGTTDFTCSDAAPTNIEFKNRERGWNLLFDLDLLLWLLRIIYSSHWLPDSWLILSDAWLVGYDIISNVLFAIWIIHFILIRKRYFKFK